MKITYLFDDGSGLSNCHLPLFALFAAAAPLGELKDLVCDEARVGAVKCEACAHASSSSAVAPAARRHLNFNSPVVQCPFFEQGSKIFALVLVGVLPHQHVQDALLDRCRHFGHHLLLEPLARHGNGHVDEVANDLIYVLAVEAHLGKLCGLDFDKGRLAELGDAAGNLGLATTRRANHQNVLRNHLVLQLVAQLVAPPSVAQRDRHCSLRIALPYNKLVQLLHHLARLECCQQGRVLRDLRVGGGGKVCERNTPGTAFPTNTALTSSKSSLTAISGTLVGSGVLPVGTVPDENVRLDLAKFCATRLIATLI